MKRYPPAISARSIAMRSTARHSRGGGVVGFPSTWARTASATPTPRCCSSRARESRVRSASARTRLDPARRGHLRKLAADGQQGGRRQARRCPDRQGSRGEW